MKKLRKHLDNLCETLSKYYDLTSISSHSGNIGFSRELISKHFLSINLPSSVVFSGGEIFDSDDNISGQIDLIIYPRSAPSLNIAEGINLIPVDAVLAVIECKSNLTTGSMEEGSSHLKLSLDACKKVKLLKRINHIGAGVPGEIVEGNLTAHTNTPYMIFAFDGPEEKTLREKLYDYQKVNNLSLEMMPEVITVLSKGYYLVQNNGWYIRKVSENVHWSKPSEDGMTLVGMYMYLMKIIESHGMSNKALPMTKYL